MLADTRYCRPRLVVTISLAGLLLVVGAAATVYGQTTSGMYLALGGSAALEPEDVIGTAGVGVQVGYRWPWGILVQGDFWYTGKDFYYFDTDSRAWRQAASWREVPSRGVSRGDWPFYRERLLLGLGAGLSGRIRSVGLFSTVGFMVSVLDIAEMGDSYPEFADAATVSSMGEVESEVNAAVRAGVVWPADKPVSGQLSYLVLLRDDSDVAGERAWIQRNSLITLGVTLHLGRAQ